MINNYLFEVALNLLSNPATTGEPNNCDGIAQSNHEYMDLSLKGMHLGEVVTYHTCFISKGFVQTGTETFVKFYLTKT